MRRRLTLVLCGLLMSLAGACDSSGDDSSSEGPIGASPPAETTTTSWSVDSFGTSQVPAYGNSCRFATANHVAMAANTAPDDSVALVKEGNHYGLELTVSDGAGSTASFSVSLGAGLSRRSYRDGTGSAQGAGMLAGLSGTVADAALCFESKLSPGESVAGEFSVVVLNSAGEHVSLGGDFVLDSDSVFPDGSTSDAVLVDASELRVDLE